jgi:hypothetical protein
MAIICQEVILLKETKIPFTIFTIIGLIAIGALVMSLGGMATGNTTKSYYKQMIEKDSGVISGPFTTIPREGMECGVEGGKLVIPEMGQHRRFSHLHCVGARTLYKLSCVGGKLQVEIEQCDEDEICVEGVGCVKRPLGGGPAAYKGFDYPSGMHEELSGKPERPGTRVGSSGLTARPRPTNTTPEGPRGYDYPSGMQRELSGNTYNPGYRAGSTIGG